MHRITMYCTQCFAIELLKRYKTPKNRKLRTPYAYITVITCMI